MEESGYAAIAKLTMHQREHIVVIRPGSRGMTLHTMFYSNEVRAAEALHWLAVMVYPVMPNSANAIYQQLGLNDQVSKADPRELGWGDLKPGTEIKEVKPLFPRIDKAKTMEEIKEQTSEVRDQKAESSCNV